MRSERHRSLAAVLGALSVLVVLAGLLAVRLMARETPAAPAAAVPPPLMTTLAELEVPCWSCPNAAEWPIAFRTDLDLLAPLGDGSANAAEFFAVFRKELGPRRAEAEAFMARRTVRPGLEDYGQVVPDDDPLLAEAEPWVDQATMRFYPELIPLEGVNTGLPDLLVMLTMARTWTARGVAAEEPEIGLEDCRRAIRLGRLLRQEDVVLINDLVGLACIHVGARGVYDIARRTGDAHRALLASVVVGEVAPQRLYSSQRVTRYDLGRHIRLTTDGTAALVVPDAALEELTSALVEGPDRRFRVEAMVSAQLVMVHGTADQADRARSALERLAAGDDAVLAKTAGRLLTGENAPTLDQLVARRE